jgi:hypothetical protein
MEPRTLWQVRAIASTSWCRCMTDGRLHQFFLGRFRAIECPADASLAKDQNPVAHSNEFR